MFICIHILSYQKCICMQIKYTEKILNIEMTSMIYCRSFYKISHFHVENFLFYNKLSHIVMKLFK